MRIPPTVGLNLGKFDVNSKTRMTFWDLGGQLSLRVLWDNYYSEANAVAYVLDSTDRDRFPEARREIEKILDDKDLLDAPLLVVANKQDMKSAVPPEEIIKELNLDVRKRAFRIQPVSAIAGSGVRELISWLLTQLPDCPRTARLAER